MEVGRGGVTGRDGKTPYEAWLESRPSLADFERRARADQEIAQQLRDAEAALHQRHDQKPIIEFTPELDRTWKELSENPITAARERLGLQAGQPLDLEVFQTKARRNARDLGVIK